MKKALSIVIRILVILRVVLFVAIAAVLCLVVLWPVLSLSSAQWGIGAVKSSRPAPVLGPVKIMPLGDSVTEGSSIVVKNGYRLELLKRLEGYPIDFVGTYEYGSPALKDQNTQGEAGACIRANPCSTTSMFEQTAGWVKQSKPDIVIINGGSNDYCCGREAQDDTVVQNSMRDWTQLIWETKPDVSIVVIGMPDHHPGFKDWLPGYVAEQANAGKKISYVSLDGVATYDAIHPNAAGYKTLAGRLADEIRPILDERKSDG